MKLVTTTWLSLLLSKPLYGNTLRHTWDTVILLNTHFEHFPAIENLKKFFCCKPLWICVKLVTTTWISPLLNKKMHKNTLRHTWDTVICLKQLILSILSIFQVLKNLKKSILLQTIVNMCETGHNNMTFSTVEQKIAWEYLEAYLSYSDFA